MRSKTKALYLLSVSVLLAVLFSCKADTQCIHTTFIPISQKGWMQCDTLKYAMPPLKNTNNCDFSLLLHAEGYNYGNIALDITIQQDTTLVYHELRDYLLCENLPAEGFGRRCDYTLPVGNFVLCDTLPTIITLVHRIDQPMLKGVREVGVRVSAPIRQHGGVIWRVDWN